MMTRPSNSGTATWFAASSGLTPSSSPSQSSRERVRHRACRIGTSSAASAPVSQLSSSSPALAVAGFDPPAASTVVTRTSACRSTATSSSSGRAQRRAEHRLGHPAGVDHRAAQGVDERGVPGHVVRAVVDDRDAGSAGVARGAIAGIKRAEGRHFTLGRLPALEPAPVRHLGRRVEAVAGEQDGVGEEVVQLGEVLRPALGEVEVRLGGDADGDGRRLHELRVRALLAAEDDDRPRLRRREQGVEARLPRLAPAEQAHDDEVDALEQGLEVLHRDPGGVRPAPGTLLPRGAGPRRAQVGVGRRQQQQHRRSRGSVAGARESGHLII